MTGHNAVWPALDVKVALRDGVRVRRAGANEIVGAATIRSILRVDGGMAIAR
jgi:hypothetical protein